MSCRSYLYVPGDRPAMLAGARRRGADALIIDLEDAVAPAAKAAARRRVADWLEHQPSLPPGPPGSVSGPPGSISGPPGIEIWVRVNAFSAPRAGATEEDLRAVVGPGVTGICLAKCQSAGEAERLGDLLAAAEQRAGLEPASLRIAALLESARGLLAATLIAAVSRVDRLQLGEADLCAELGLAPGPEETELLPLRAQLVLASAAAGLDAPVGPVSTDFRDLDRFRAGTQRLRRLGFGGRAVIHPAQIPVVNEVFTPSAAEAEAARSVIGRFAAAAARGSGTALAADGTMIDEAVVLAARRTLARARHAARWAGRP